MNQGRMYTYVPKVDVGGSQGTSLREKHSGRPECQARARGFQSRGVEAREGCRVPRFWDENG